MGNIGQEYELSPETEEYMDNLDTMISNHMDQ